MPELQPGDPRRLGSYEIVERLGEGGQGVVYAGIDASGNKAAIKLLRADLAVDAMARNRFVREAQAAKQEAQAAKAAAKALPPEMITMMPGMDYFISEHLFAMVRFARWDELLAEPRPPEKYQVMTALTSGFLGRGPGVLQQWVLKHVRTPLAGHRGIGNARPYGLARGRYGQCKQRRMACHTHVCDPP